MNQKLATKGWTAGGRCSNGNMYQNNPRMEIKASAVVVPNTPLPSVDKKHSSRAILLLGALFIFLP